MERIVRQTKNTDNKFQVIIGVIIFFIITINWILFTKVGLINNFLNIEFLCPNNSNNNPTRELLPNDPMEMIGPDKPVIYLYPKSIQDTSIRLSYKGTLTSTYPEYANSWNIIAYPDGQLINKADNKTYSYLFWEGKETTPTNWDQSKGFVIKGSDTREFLQESLSKIGLIPKEYNEFIVYWYPLMKDNPYNLISFAGKQYTDTAPLDISPKPDSMLRVFMVYKPLTERISVKPQVLQPFERKGFTVVEWGGTRNAY